MSLLQAISHLKSDCNLFEQLIRQTNDCEWILQSQLGQGVQARVYKVCCRQPQSQALNDENCDFIAKVAEGKGINFLRKLKNEIIIQQMAARISVAPFIVDGFVCNNEAIIVMKKVDMTVKDYARHLFNKGLTQSQVFEKIQKIEDEVVKHVKSLHEFDIFHDDLHIDNIMVNLKKNDSLDFDNVKIIDFGKSSITTDQDLDKIESPKDINMTFNLLRSIINEGKLFEKKASTPIKQRRPSVEDDPFGTPIKSRLSFGDDDEDEKSTPIKFNLSDDFEASFTPRKPSRSPPPAPRKKR